MGRVQVPLLFVRSDSDRVASPEANRVFAERIQSPDKTVWSRPDEFHEVLNETARAELHHQVAEWIVKHANYRPNNNPSIES